MTLFRLRLALFGPRSREGPGSHFRTLFATFGPKGPNDPCSRARDSQKSCVFAIGNEIVSNSIQKGPVSVTVMSAVNRAVPSGGFHC